MESRLVFFIALVAAELIFNVVVIAMIYLAFAKMTEKVTEGMNEFQSSPVPRKWLATLQSASEQAVKATGTVKEQFKELEPSLVRMQAAHAENLEKAGERFKLACRAAKYTAESVQNMLTWPLTKASTGYAFVQGVIDFIRGSESDSDASSRRTR